MPGQHRLQGQLVRACHLIRSYSGQQFQGPGKALHESLCREACLDTQGKTDTHAARVMKMHATQLSRNQLNAIDVAIAYEGWIYACMMLLRRYVLLTSADTSPRQTNTRQAAIKAPP